MCFILEHGNDPAKATHIEVNNVKKYVAWKSSQPLMLLHEAVSLNISSIYVKNFWLLFSDEVYRQLGDSNSQRHKKIAKSGGSQLGKGQLGHWLKNLTLGLDLRFFSKTDRPRSPNWHFPQLHTASGTPPWAEIPQVSVHNKI